MTEFRIRKALAHGLSGWTSKEYRNRLFLIMVGMMTLVYTFNVFLIGPYYGEYFSTIILVVQDQGNLAANLRMQSVSAKLSLFGLLYNLIYWLIIASNETAFHKNIFFKTEKRPIPQSLGASEFKLMAAQLVVYVLGMASLVIFYLGLIFAAVILVILFAALSSVSSIIASVICTILGIAALLFWMGVSIYIVGRLSPAAALTIRDNEIRFPEAWTLTKGMGLPIMWSYLIAFLLFTVAMIVQIGVVGYLLLGDGELWQSLSALGDDIDKAAEVVAAHLSIAKAKIIGALFIVFSSVFYSIFYLIFAGIGNYAVLVKQRSETPMV